MDWLSDILNTLAMAGIFAAIAYFAKKDNKKPHYTMDGALLLTVNRFYKYFGLLMLILALAVIVISFIVEYQEGDWIIIASFFVILAGLGIAILRFHQNHRALLRQDEIEVVSWLGKRRILRWDMIESLYFNSVTGYIKLKSAKKKHYVKVYQHLVGLNHLAIFLKTKSNFTDSDLKYPHLFK